MADHLVVMSFVMHDMDGTPEQSAEIVASDWQVLRDYWQDVETEYTAEDITPVSNDTVDCNECGTWTYEHAAMDEGWGKQYDPPLTYWYCPECLEYAT